MARGPIKRVAIDIGSSAIRLLIAELRGKGWKILENAERPVALGEDVFVSGRISRKTLMQALQILHSCRELMAPYPVSNVIAIATSALREARNRDTFVDRVFLRTGIKVRVIEGIEANRLTYMAVQKALRQAKPALSRSNAIIMEVGAGSTEVMLLSRGQMVAAHTLPLGTIRLEQQLRPSIAAGAMFRGLLREHIRSTLDVVGSELPLKRISQFIAVGGSARLAAGKVGSAQETAHTTIAKESLTAFIRKLERLSLDDIVSELNITYAEAEPLVTALLVYWLFFEATSASKILVPAVSIREGLLLDFAAGADALEGEFRQQIIASGMSLARKYAIDEAHAQQVTSLALTFFGEMQRDHGLCQRHKLLLEVAALLHDIGTYISAGDHQKHGRYIIANSEIFGLARDDLRIITNVVGYHRGPPPQPSDLNYASLSRDERIVVLKLTAILRVADALDRGHNRRITDFSVEQTEDEFIIRTSRQDDLALERYSLANKGDLFEEVYGLKVTLR